MDYNFEVCPCCKNHYGGYVFEALCDDPNCIDFGKTFNYCRCGWTNHECEREKDELTGL